MRTNLFVLAVLGIALASCNGVTSGVNGRDGRDGRDGSTGTQQDEFAPKPCQPPCQAPQLCSKVGVCIDPGTCADSVDCAPGEACDPVKKSCVPRDQCGSQELAANPVAPNLLIVLDRSCSMKDTVGGQRKFNIAVAALGNLLTKNAGRFRFGLTLFPDIAGDKCSQGAIPIPVAPGNEAKIKSLLTGALNQADPYFPDGPCVTNIDSAMQQAAADPALKTPDRESFVLLITDGKQYGCNLAGGDNGTTQIITGLRKSGVSTFVVGFGGAVDPAQLNIFADAGGKPRPDPITRYHKAEDQPSLDAALATISKESFGCVFKLQQPPPQLQKIYVFFDRKEVLQDKSHLGGWDYDAASGQVTFYGQSCRDLTDGKVADLQFVYGCQKPVDPEKSPPTGCPPGVTTCQSNDNCSAGYACVARCCNKVLQ